MSSASTRPAGSRPDRKTRVFKGYRVEPGEPLEWQVLAIPSHDLLVFTTEPDVKIHDGQQLDLASEIFDHEAGLK